VRQYEAQTANIGFCVIWAEHWKSNLHIANQLFVPADRITDELLNVTSTSYLYSATYPGRRFSNIQTTQSPERYVPFCSPRSDNEI
jgi:hypothetical protein